MKIICIGRNYGLHAKELGNEIPDKPVIFCKPDTALLKNNDDFYLPSFSKDVHYEAEIVVKIDKAGKSILPQFASRYYSQITLGIDFTARDVQNELKSKGLPWELAKAFDYSAVIGNFIPINKPIQDLHFHLLKNGNKVQNGHTGDMLFNVDQIISFVSEYFTLKTGDLIFTGTPAGVGPVAIGDNLKGFIEDEEIFDFLVK
jgi:2-keto-4-pentenoate hydratase/2-oxohepta-3-ene-1,7-dioic acid hydratase in catechol pathway